jgi:3-carboxy-cis,cis-muconate cycloisomerase
MGKVGSSTMPHKRNPMMCEAIVATGKLIQMQVVPALSDMIAENERDMRGWQAEWSFLAETCCFLSGMLFYTNTVLGGLQVYPANMQRNLDLLHGLLLSENVMLVLGAKIGRQEAHELVYQISMKAFENNIPLKQLLLEHAQVRDAAQRHPRPDQIYRLGGAVRGSCHWKAEAGDRKLALAFPHSRWFSKRRRG